ncbi:MAG TPA: glycosyltransferase [Haliangiales bacterium]|nr:glycosyltransferase [Haliangiales bacterium]
MEHLTLWAAKMVLLEQKIVEPSGPVSRRPSSYRFLFYSHDGLGLGHTRRHLAVARALTGLAPDSSVLLATGSDMVSRLGLKPSIDILKLPELRKVSNDEYASRRLRIPVSEIRALRSALLHAAVRAYRPTVVLVDKHPFGAKGEFRAGLEELRAAGGCAVLGLRDILDEPGNVFKEWSAYRMRERIAEFYDLVLVYGERSVFNPVAEYEFPEALAARTRFCGYVVNRDEAEAAAEPRSSAVSRANGVRRTVLATAGGGEDGFFLLQTFIRAAARASWEGIAVAGPMSPGPELKTLQRLARESKVTLHPFLPNLSQMFRTVDALVCMGGYNTLVEAVSHGVPTVCVPRIRPRSEQLIRARAFERLGLLSVIEPEKLDRGNLDRAIQSVFGTARQGLLDRVHSALSFDGARQAAGHLLALASARSSTSPVAGGRAAV